MKKVIIIILAVLLAFLVFYFLKIFDFYRFIYTPKQATLSPISEKKVEKTNYSILLLGYAGGQHQGTYLTDTVIVLTFDFKKKKAFMISVPRDVWVKLPTKSGNDFHTKINSVYETELFPHLYPDLDTKKAGSKSDAELTKRVLTQLTGFTIDNYVAIDFESFTNSIDVLGGVDINVLKSFDDEKYPIEGKEDDACEKKDAEFEEALKLATQEPELAFPCRYEKIHFDAGTQHMDGTTALKFVRSRQSPQDGGDFARARRQQQLLEALKNKILSVGFVAKIPSLLDETKKYVKTDIDPLTIQVFLKELPTANQYSLTSIVLSDQNVLKAVRSDDRQFILTSKEGVDTWIEVQKFIKNTIEGITPIPSRLPTPLSK